MSAIVLLIAFSGLIATEDCSQKLDRAFRVSSAKSAPLMIYVYDDD
ncbi:MAG: hypothetical protein AAF456_16635 [Planctomycetota bacterium]